MMMRIHIFSALLMIVCSLSANGQSSIEVQPLGKLNTERMEFAPVVHGTRLVYTASSDAWLVCRTTAGDAYTDLYEVERQGDSLGTPRRMPRHVINGRYNDGAATFIPGGTGMIFTRNNLEGKNDSNFINLKLYRSELSEEGVWSNGEALPFNDDYYDHAHPALSADGRRLYFASNRPGGYGGMDIWMSEWDGRQWSTPVNLGPAVNSPGNEIFPFVDSEENLFFASDSLPGRLGGLDVFAARLNAAETWELVGPLPQPINTPYDDFSLVVDKNFREGYFASNRPGGAGADDLYRFRYEPRLIPGKVIVIDELTGERIPDAAVLVEPGEIANPFDRLYHPAALNPAFELPIKGGEGTFDLVPSATRYHLAASHPDYFPKEADATVSELAGKDGYVIALRRREILRQLQVIVLDRFNKVPVPEAQVTFEDQTAGQRQTLLTDSSGTFVRELNCEHDYFVEAGRTNYVSDAHPLTDLLPHCLEQEMLYDTLWLRPYIVIRLDKVYFDFDKADIRPDVAPVLDRVVEVMKQFPGLRFKVNAHTDSRGNDAYNLELSKRRAKSVMDYLISKGIAPDRLQWEGFGETRLTNECDDGVPCTEAQHAANRRVELEVLSMEGVENVEIIFK